MKDPSTFWVDYYVLGGISTCSGVFRDPMFLWISSNSFPLNLLLVRSHQPEIIMVKHLIQGRNNLTMVRVEPSSFDQGLRKKRRLCLLAHAVDKGHGSGQRCFEMLALISASHAINNAEQHLIAVCYNIWCNVPMSCHISSNVEPV